MTNGLIRVAQTRVELDDPHLTIDYRDRLGIRFALYESLVKRQSDGSFAPSLATAWTVADDARTWHFTLRHGVRFHIGAILRPADVVASLERVRDGTGGGELGTGGVIQGYLHGATFDTEPGGTVRVVTAEPMADLLDLLVDLPIVPEAVIGNDVIEPIGTGPFRLDEREDGRVRARRWEGYWGESPVTQSVEWQREPDATRRLDALLSGDVQIATDLPETSRAVIERGEGVRFVDAPSAMAVGFICNSAAGVCADRRVRQALNYALDLDAIITETGRVRATPLNGPLTPFSLGHDPGVLPFPHDPVRARQLLTEVGFGDGLNVTLDVPERLPDEAPILGAVLAEQFAAIGVETTVRSFSDRPGYAEMVRAKQIDDACCFDSTPISTYRVLREKIHGGVRGPWWQGYRNDEVDRLLDLAAATPEREARQDRYRQAYRLIHADAPWLFLYAPRLTWGTRHDAQWSTSPTGVMNL